MHVYIAVLLLDWYLVHSSCLLNVRRFLMNCCMSAIDLMQSLQFVAHPQHLNITVTCDPVVVHCRLYNFLFY